MWAVFLGRPPAHKSLRPMWDVSIKHISDLTLLDTSPGHMTSGSHRVVFQLRFESKLCRLQHNIPVVALEQVQDPLLCPVLHIGIELSPLKLQPVYL